MSLPPARSGASKNLYLYPIHSSETTIGDVQKLQWISIRHICSKEIARDIIYNRHSVRDKDQVESIANNVAIYVNHAYEFYKAATHAESNTAPLFYYYSFMNLAKAICEIRHPGFDRQNDGKYHGLTRKRTEIHPICLDDEVLEIKGTGVWPAFVEAVTRRRPPEQMRIPVKDLFSYCPEIMIEFESSFGPPSNIVPILDAAIMTDDKNSECWITLTIETKYLSRLGLTENEFLEYISVKGIDYKKVHSDSVARLKVELIKPGKITEEETQSIYYQSLDNDIKGLNIFTIFAKEGKIYIIPIQKEHCLKMPQIVILYSIMFWLGSLVRYDPHGVKYLQDSKYWSLIDGYINQSRRLLLELFYWELFQQQRTLNSVW